ncbi:MAG: hypothetical protein ACR2NN_02310 [Bryobacteraceae bacterium]
MNAADALIDKIVSSAQIPSGRRRLEIARELRAHMEDFVLIAQQSSDEEIQRLLLANFGDPQEIAQEFAWVYRRERAILRISVYLLSTLAAASLVSVVVLALQTSMAIGMGVPCVLDVHHMTLETLYILFTVATYVGFISFERLFDRSRFQKTTASMVVIFAVLAAGFTITNTHAEIVLFGFLSGMLLRTIPVFFKNRASRIGAVLACFGLFGLVSACRQSPDLQNEGALKLAVWVAIGACCYPMTHLAARMHRVLLNGVQKV